MVIVDARIFDGYHVSNGICNSEKPGMPWWPSLVITVTNFWKGRQMEALVVQMISSDGNHYGWKIELS